MEVRPNSTVDNSSVQHQSPPSKQPKASPIPVDTTSVTQRLQKELMSLMMSGDLGVSAFPESESIFTWIGTIEGGRGSMYEGLSYKLSLRFPLDYPFKPPQVKFETMCFHPNVDQYGNICLDILQDVVILRAPQQPVTSDGNLHCDWSQHVGRTGLWPVTVTSGHQLMIVEQFFCPFKVCWESPTQKVLSTIMLHHYGVTRKSTEKWSTNSILLGVLES